MANHEDFEKYEKRLASVDTNIRSLALEYASAFFAQGNITREEALEKGISKANFVKRNP